jgi:hypothetical protein
MLMKKVAVLAGEIETTVGTAESVLAADAVWNAYNVNLQPALPMHERAKQGTLSPQAAVPGMYGARLTFSVDMTGGTTDPLWATVGLPTCGFVASGNVYTPISKGPGASGGPKTATFALYRNGTIEKIAGCAGTAVFHFVCGEPVRIDFDYMGKYVTPLWSDGAILAPTYETLIPPRFAGNALTITGGAAGSPFTPRLKELTLDLGNKVILREDASDATGYLSAMITGRKFTVKMDPESNLVAANSPRADWIAGTQLALAWEIAGTNNGVEFAAPKAQYMKVETSDREDNLVDSVEFQLNANAAAGDDELTITLADT